MTGIVGDGYDSQLSLNRDDLDLQRFVSENNIELPQTESKTAQNNPQQAVANRNAVLASVATQVDGAGPAKAKGEEPQGQGGILIVHHAPGDTGSDDDDSAGGDCCKDAAPKCMACKAGITIAVYCMDNPIVGCPGLGEPQTRDETPPKKPEEEPKSEPLPEPVKKATPEPIRECTIEVAENNQGCPTARCASEEAVRNECRGKDFEQVKEIGDPANCCLKPCNFRCLEPKGPSYGKQAILNSNSKQPDEMPKEQDMQRLDYDQESKLVVKPVIAKAVEEPKEAPKAEEPKQADSKTIYQGQEVKKVDVNEAAKDPTVSLELFDSTITSNSFTFSYSIANVNPDGGYYWTVQRKEQGSLLASTVEKDGEKEPCSGYGSQGQETKNVNVNVDCPFAPGKEYLLWFALDLDSQGGGVFLSPGEPVALKIPMSKPKANEIASTTMSAYGYALMLNNGKPMEPTTEDEPEKEPEEEGPVVHHVMLIHQGEDSEESQPPQQEQKPTVMFHVLKRSDSGEDDEGKNEEEAKEAEKKEMKKAVKEAKETMKKEAQKVLKKHVETAEKTAKEAKKVLKDAKKTKEELKEKVEKADESGDGESDGDKADLKDSLKEGAKKAKKLEKKAKEAHEKAKKAVESTKKKMKKLESEGSKELKDINGKVDLDKLKDRLKKAVKGKKKEDPSDMEEDDEEKGESKKAADKGGKYVVGAMSGNGIIVKCKACPKKKNEGKLYYLMLNQKQNTPEGGITATHVYHTFVNHDNDEEAVSGFVDMDRSHEFQIQHDFGKGKFQLYLAADADGKGKKLASCRRRHTSQYP